MAVNSPLLCRMKSLCLVAFLFEVLIAGVTQQFDYCAQDATVRIQIDQASGHEVLNYKVRTRLRDDDTGYAKGLRCKWELWASDYSKPRQMLLSINKVDFDSDATSERQCDNSAQLNSSSDVFSFSYPTADDKQEVFRLCSNSDSKNLPTKILANFNNFSGSNSDYLTIEFRSDSVQARSNAAGVELEVEVMTEGSGCSRYALFHDGVCYLVTDLPLNFTDSLNMAAKDLQGNLATFPTVSSLDGFLMLLAQPHSKNKSPLELSAGRFWIGHLRFKRDPAGLTKLMDRCNECRLTNSCCSFNFTPDSSLVCGVAIRLISGKLIFTCESLDLKLPALIGFPHVGSRCSSAYVTCGPHYIWPIILDLDQPNGNGSPRSENSRIGLKTGVSLAFVCLFVFLAIAIVLLLYFRPRLRTTILGGDSGSLLEAKYTAETQ